jgi:hypothetical protein
LIHDNRDQQITEANPTKELSPDTIRNHIDHFRPILRRIDMHAERPLTKGGVDHFAVKAPNPLEAPVMMMIFFMF